MSKTTVLIIDDHAILRMGLASLINAERDLQVIGDAEDGEDGIRKVRKLHPNIIIMDLIMPEMDGAEATERILAEDPKAKILILTTYGTSDALARVLAAGARGAVLKNIPFPELVHAIRAIAAGKRFIAADIERILPLPTLSPRQTEILEAIAKGLSNQQIATALGIGPDVVKLHINALFQKLGAINRAEAVAIAMRKHLLKT